MAQRELELLTRTIRIIGLTGRAGSGKTTAAREIVRRAQVDPEHGCVPLSLAQYFKVPAVAAGSLPAKEVFGPWNKSLYTRRMLQRRGTEEGRDALGENIWLRHAEADLYRLSRYGIEMVVIDDVRFLNEAEWVLAHGGILVRLAGRGAELEGSAADHPSEAAIASLPVDLELNTKLLSPYGVGRAIHEFINFEDFGGAREAFWARDVDEYWAREKEEGEKNDA